jgi:hypothetical protein
MLNAGWNEVMRKTAVALPIVAFIATVTFAQSGASRPLQIYVIDTEGASTPCGHGSP